MKLFKSVEDRKAELQMRLQKLDDRIAKNNKRRERKIERTARNMGMIFYRGKHTGDYGVF